MLIALKTNIKDNGNGFVLNTKLKNNIHRQCTINHVKRTINKMPLFLVKIKA